MDRSLHLPFLVPIERYLTDNNLAITAYSAPPFFAGDEILPGWGLTDRQLEYVQGLGRFYTQPTDFEPDVTIVADACHSAIPQLKRVINVGHGMICKGAFYTDKPQVRRENISKMLLVPGPWHKERLRENVFIPIVTTGFIKSDQLFGPDAVSRKEFCKKQHIDPDKKIILFAPTYNPELSAIPCVEDKIADLADNDTTLLIKLHNLTTEHWKQMYSDLAARNPNIHYLTDNDYSGMMNAADLLVSDVSSIFIEFILLDKPVVLFDNPRMTEFELYNPDEIEYLTRDAAVSVDSMDKLFNAVKKELSHPGKLSAKRREYAEKLDYKRDGKSAQRAAQTILDWCAGKIPLPSSPKISVVLVPDDTASVEDINEDLQEINRSAAGIELEIFIWHEGAKAGGAADNTARIYDFKELRRLDTDLILFVRGGKKYPQDALKWLHTHFLWNENAGIIKAVTDREIARSILERLDQDTQLADDKPEIAAWALLVMGIGQSISGRAFGSTCIMCKKMVLDRILEMQHLPQKDNIFAILNMTAARMGLDVLLAADCYVWE
ncbi:MAG: CDP-glycerol glycerophosphotransferase family protein [Desulfovibrionales bacterium]